MAENRIEPLFNSLDHLDHDDALRIVRRLHLRFPCLTHATWYCCPHPWPESVITPEVSTDAE